MINKICLYCSKQFLVIKCRENTAKYCSNSCLGLSQKCSGNPMFGKPTYGHAGHKHSEESKNKIRIKAIGRVISKETRLKISMTTSGRPSHLKGTHLSDEHKSKLKLSALRGKDSPHWRGGFTPRPVQVTAWSKKVKERDGYRCVECNYQGIPGNKDTHADHIKPWSKYIDLRFELSNGRTLCVPCHKKTSTYGRTRKIRQIECVNS